MAHVVCQVLARADQLTLIWSEGEASFAPYVFDGPQVAELRRLTGQAHELLARLGAMADESVAPADAGHQLAQTGHALYRLLFQEDQPAGAPGQDVRNWLQQRTRTETALRLDIVGDSLSVPWTIVYDQPADQAAFARSDTDRDCWKAFWGQRYALYGGRRVQWLRGRELPAKPAVVLALDPALRAALPHEEQKRLSDFLDKFAAVVVESKHRLADVFATQEVDLLYLFGRADGCSVCLGPDRLTPADLERILLTEAANVGRGETLVVVNPAHDPQRDSSSNLLSAFERFSNVGLIGVWQPLAAGLANRLGLELLQQFVDQRKPLGQALNAVRERQPAAAALFFGCCPPELRLADAEETNITAGSAAPELDSGREPFALPDTPYQMLAPLGVDEAALLVGRELDITSVASLLDGGDTRLLLVHGAAGAGKSSLVQAGIVPYLEDQCIGYRVLRDRSSANEATEELAYPVLAVRATSDLAGQLALILCSFCARPLTYITPAGNSIVVDLPALLAKTVSGSQTAELADPETLRSALRQQPDLLGRVLAALTQGLPFELVLLVEQADDLFSLLKPGAKGRDVGRTLTMLRAALAAPARAKLVLSLRTEYLGRWLDPLSQTPEDAQQVRTFLTPELTEDQLVEIVLQPTSAEPLPNTEEVAVEKYGFRFEQGLAETLAAEAIKFGGQNQESVLVLLHVVCTRLWRLVGQRADKVIRAADLKAIGGVEKGLNKYVESLLKSTTGRDKRALTKLVLDLFIRQPDGSLTRDLLFQEDVKAQWLGATPLEHMTTAVAADGVRLLDVTWLNVGGREGNYLSLGHDALAPVAAQHAEETTRRAYGWTKMGDALWITVPLLILLGVFTVRQMYVMTSANDKLREEAKQFDDVYEQIKKERGQLEDVNLATKWPAYLGHMRSAEQAYLAGDMVRMRQALLAAQTWPALLRARPEMKDDVDLRGFEWYYLWALMHQNRATLLGHRGTVVAVAAAPDGLTVASAGADGTVRLWDAARGRELFKLDVKGENVVVPSNGLTFSPDGSMLAVAAGNKVVVWQFSRLGLDHAPSLAMFVASLPLQYAGPLANLSALAGRTLSGNSVKERFVLSDHDAPVLAVAFAPRHDGNTLAAGCKDNSVKLWDLGGPKPALRQTLKEHTAGVQAVAWSPDGQWLATGGADRMVHIWDANKGKKEKSLSTQAGEVAALAWSADAKTLASGSSQLQGGYEGGVVKLFDTTSWQERSVEKLHVAAVSALAFAGDSKTLAVAGKDNAIRLCDAATGHERQALKGHLGWVSSVALGHGGQVLVSGSFDGTVKIWGPQRMAQRDVLPVSSAAVTAVLFAPDDRWLATGSGDGLVKLWDVGTGNEIKTLSGHKGGLLALAWGTEGKTLISGGADGVLKLWDTDSGSATFGQELDTVKAHAREVVCLASADKGKTLASGSPDGSVKVWALEGTKFAKGPVEIKTEGGAVHCLALRDDGRLLVTGHEDTKLRLWNPLSGKEAEYKTAVFSGHTARLTAVAFLLDDPGFLLTASADRTLKLWEITSGKETMTRHGHSGSVTGLALTKDRHNFVTCSADHSVKVWDPDMRRQQERITLLGQGPLRAVAFSADRRIIAAAGQDGSVQLWRSAAREGNILLPVRGTLLP